MYIWRFHLTAREEIVFPPGKAANTLRGALGSVLRRRTNLYQRIFAPSRNAGPSGLADPPRPFVLRTARLDGQVIPAGAPFCFDLHVFETRLPMLEHFEAAFGEVGAEGIGPARGRAALDRVENAGTQPLVLSLCPEGEPISRVVVQFLTPTELKHDGRIVSRPEFGVLFARVRDRIASLRALYGDGPLNIDFDGLGERANAVRLTRSDIRQVAVERRSSRTGQTHPLGGFVGEAEYAGDLADFLPWLRAAEWTGVGRQTVWGKGEIRVLHL
jgi:hypothetical protein